MALDREPIASALFARLQIATGVITAGRKLISWDALSTEAQPALYLIQSNQTPEQTRGLPTRWKLNFTAYLYCRNESKDEAPSIQLNRMIRAIEAALELQPNEVALPDPSNMGIHTTLGGLCSHVWISGTIETDEGALGDQAVAIIPIEALSTI